MFDKKCLKDYRCKSCNKLFFKGEVRHAIIQVKCKNCKQMNTIHGTDCKIWLLADGDKHSYLRGTDECSLNDAMLECEHCMKTKNIKEKDCRDMKDEGICPMCKQKLEN